MSRHWLLITLALLASGCAGEAVRPDLVRLYASSRDDHPQPPVVVIHGILGAKMRDRRSGEEIWPGSLTKLLTSDYQDLAVPLAQGRAVADQLEPYALFESAAGQDFYGEIIHTRDYQDRLDTLTEVRDAGMKTCCGGIVGMGETRQQRAGLIQALANLPAHPQSVPINKLVKVSGTPLADDEQLDDIDPFEFVRMIAVARITMPESMVRLSAGREAMSDELQALCFAAGANSIFYGEKLLTTGNPDVERDQALFARLGIEPMPVAEPATVHAEVTRPVGQAA